MPPMFSLLDFRGRLPRLRFLGGLVALAVAFALLFAGLDATLGRTSTLLLYPPLFWGAFVLCSRRLHDRDKSAAWLLLVLLPLLGPAWLVLELMLFRGSPGPNRHGPDPRRQALDYFQVR